jgi:hypothetical protein
MRSNHLNPVGVILLIAAAFVIVISQLAIMIYVQRTAHRIKVYSPTIYPTLFPSGWFVAIYTGNAGGYLFNFRLVKNQILIDQLAGSSDPILQNEGNRLNSAFNMCNFALYLLLIIPIYFLFFNKVN